MPALYLTGDYWVIEGNFSSFIFSDFPIRMDIKVFYIRGGHAQIKIYAWPLQKNPWSPQHSISGVPQ